MLPIYYINLARRTDRREFMEAQLARLGLVGIRIEAVTPADLSADDVARYCDSSRPTFLRENELSCTLSHERCWQAMLDGGFERALILEDDAELSVRLPEFVREAGLVDADLVRIETTGAPTRVYATAQTLPSGIALRPFRSTPMGSAGYVIRAEAAKRIIGHPSLRRRHLDLALYNPFEEPGKLLSRVLTEPALCRQLGVKDEQNADLGRSDIAEARAPSQYAKDHAALYAGFTLWGNLKTGLRNLVDHFAQRSKGLERRVIPFARSNDS